MKKPTRLPITPSNPRNNFQPPKYLPSLNHYLQTSRDIPVNQFEAKSISTKTDLNLLITQKIKSPRTNFELNVTNNHRKYFSQLIE